MNSIVSIIITLVLSVLALTNCSGPVPISPPGHQPEGIFQGENTPVGTWFEQEPYGWKLVITEDTITAVTYDDEYSYTVGCSFEESGGSILIQPDDEFYFYVDMFYDPELDIITGYTMPVLDGDGGYKYREFCRTEYTPPPPPVYPPPVDLSDPDAQKEFDDLTISRMHVSFYDEGMPYDSSSSMAQEPPYADEYSYDLEVLDDGTGLVSSSFCQEIELPKEIIDTLQELVLEADLGQINGVDIHTEGLPYGSAWYEAEIELMSGEIIRSSANGEDVPENWRMFQEPMHHLLFFAFVDAGYHYNGGDFHSTKPMKRLYASNRMRKEETGILQETVYIVPDWEKAYEYSLDTHYFTFSDPDNRYPELMKTLEELSLQYKETAEEELRKDYEMMEEVPASVWQQKERRYCYSLYAVDHWEINNNLFSFMVSEGHANSLGVGENGYGQYRYIRYFIDIQTGKILSLTDLFISPEAVADFVTEHMVSRFGTHNDTGKRVHADDFPQALAQAVLYPEPEGIGWTLSYDALTLWMPLSMFPTSDSQLMEVIYYDEIQDILSDAYAEVW